MHSAVVLPEVCVPVDIPNDGPLELHWGLDLDRHHGLQNGGTGRLIALRQAARSTQSLKNHSCRKRSFQCTQALTPCTHAEHRTEEVEMVTDAWTALQ